MTRHIVQFDKLFLSGLLEGLTAAGETVTWPNHKSAQRHAAFLQRVERGADFIRSIGTGARYSVSNVQIFPVTEIAA